MISCGEPSGDLYAGALATEIARLSPGAQITGFGGDRLRGAGASLAGDFGGLSVTGLTEALRVLPRSWRLYRRLVESARAERPDVFVPVDFPDFNFFLARALKRSIEENFAVVRVRGEISGFKRHSSGHCYLSLKDADAVIDAVCWRMTAMRLGLKPEDGMEVVCTGRLTTFPGRSKYQLVIDTIELAGVGALLKLLEERRKRLAAEGLFAAERKKKLPFLPEVIGIVTSPTGSVIRDILHRLADRFPRRVLLWPVIVQGEVARFPAAARTQAVRALERRQELVACEGIVLRAQRIPLLRLELVNAAQEFGLVGGHGSR